jgi:hypothetical protein
MLDFIRRTRLLGFGSLAAAVLALSPAFAVDGVIEINHARALAGNITPGDGPGYPIFLNSSGSYRLTSDLNAAVSNDGIVITADNVTLDLNGFTLYGGGGLIADGISIAQRKNIEIKNGTVRGFTRSGIFSNITTQYIRVINVRAFSNVTDGIDLQGQGNIIDGCTAIGNGSGMRVFEGSLVTDSVARGNTNFGLYLVGGSGYRSCVVTGNNGGDANPQVGGTGFQLGTNICGTDTVCP